LEVYLWAFLIGGLICGLGQLFLEYTPYLPGHLLVLLVVSGAVLSALGIYEKLIELAGAGVTVPVSNFGNILAQGVIFEVKRDGMIGLFRGIMEIAGGGLTATIVIGFLISLIFRTKE